jgi:hypothetical protein
VPADRAVITRPPVFRRPEFDHNESCVGLLIRLKICYALARLNCEPGGILG